MVAWVSIKKEKLKMRNKHRAECKGLSKLAVFSWQSRQDGIFASLRLAKFGLFIVLLRLTKLHSIIVIDMSEDVVEEVFSIIFPERNSSFNKLRLNFLKGKSEGLKIVY